MEIPAGVSVTLTLCDSLYIIIYISIIAICNIALAGRQIAHAYACTIIINITNNTALALIKPYALAPFPYCAQAPERAPDTLYYNVLMVGLGLPPETDSCVFDL